jgi:hypothetical protein
VASGSAELLKMINLLTASIGKMMGVDDGMKNVEGKVQDVPGSNMQDVRSDVQVTAGCPG